VLCGVVRGSVRGGTVRLRRVVLRGVILCTCRLNGTEKYRSDKMSFMNIEALSNSIDFNVNSIYDVLVYFVDIASDCLIETRFVDCIDAYGLRDVLDDGVFYVPGAICLGYRITR
jgi:hypothetical protein